MNTKSEDFRRWFNAGLGWAAITVLLLVLIFVTNFSPQDVVDYLCSRGACSAPTPKD